MGRFIDDGEGHFRIEYRTPLGGIDSTAPPQFIEPNKLVNATNCLIRDGVYVPVAPQLFPWGAFPTYAAGEQFIGFGELPFIGVSGGQYNAAGYFYITASYAGGNVTLKAFQGGDLTDGVINIGNVTLPCLGALGRLSFITINQVVYFSAPGLTGICQLSLVPASITFQFQLTLLTNNLGCSFLREMNGRLLAMNVWQFDSGTGVTTNYPYQVAWSADSQQYGVWNVLDGSGNPTGAGFNNLPDVEDVITGAQFIGPTGYIYRQQGITEVTGLNSGIQPFQFNHLWASYKGIGTVYPNSLDQYGSEGAFLSDSDIFSMGLQGISSISGSAKQAIYQTLYKSNNNCFGMMCSIQINGEPQIYYILVMQPLDPVALKYQNIFWMYSFADKEWTQLLVATDVFLPMADARAFQKLLADGVTNDALASGILPIFAIQDVHNNAPLLYYIPDPSNSPTTSMQLVFPAELIAPFRDITIDGIAVYTDATDGTQINLWIGGLTGNRYQTIVADGVSNQCQGGYYKSYPFDGATAKTSYKPQLTIISAGTAAIGHVILYGTQTSSRPF